MLEALHSAMRSGFQTKRELCSRSVHFPVLSWLLDSVCPFLAVVTFHPGGWTNWDLFVVVVVVVFVVVVVVFHFGVYCF